MNTRFTLLGFLVLATVLLIAGCAQTPASQQAVQTSDSIRVAPSSLGNIIVDVQGKTLYYFAADIPASSASTCSGSCAGIWPVFYSDTIAVSPPLMASDFSSFVRADGTKQTTYRGWPLYYFQGDTGAGAVSGENVNKAWFVVKPDETVMIAEHDTLGPFLTDRMGNTLYYFAKDTPGMSACTGACIAKWPPFYASPVSAPSVLDPAAFSTVTRADGMNQTAFMGMPLYYYASDTKPGDTSGEGFNNLWYVANITGTIPEVPAAALPTTVMPTQSTMSYGGSY
jgi:predicted lipoprotein with Yx(FWY)xxD motif